MSSCNQLLYELNYNTVNQLNRARDTSVKCFFLFLHAMMDSLEMGYYTHAGSSLSCCYYNGDRDEVTAKELPGEDKASCTSKEQCGKDDIYDKHKNMHGHPYYSIQQLKTWGLKLLCSCPPCVIRLAGPWHTFSHCK